MHPRNVNIRQKQPIRAFDDGFVLHGIQAGQFYNLVTCMYEWGWGQSFHFPSIPGCSHREAT